MPQTTTPKPRQAHRLWDTSGQRIPVRTCVSCRRKRPQQELLRLVRGEGQVQIDAHRTLVGRGLWVCKDNSDCWQEKSLKRSVRFADGLTESIQNALLLRRD